MATNLPTLREQLQQLQTLHDAGVLTGDAYRDGRADLERQIVDAVMAGTTAISPEPPRPSTALRLGLGAGVLALAAAGYWWTGSPRLAITPPLAATAATEGGASAPHALSFDQIGEMARQLAERLKQSPDDAGGWAMLARSYSVLGRPADAVPAYARAVALQGDDATLLADYADALAVTRESRLQGEPSALIERALKLEPDHVKALSLAGTAAFDRKDYRGAVARWERIVKVAPPDDPTLAQVRSSIAEAQELAGLPKSAAQATPAAPGATAHVSGTVTLAAALAAQARPEDTLFVFARAPEGPRMPLAILRKQVKDLPISFRLDDAMAMTPQAKLSAFPRVVVGARISRSGNAMPQPGDLIGQTAAVAIGASDLSVEISRVVAK